MDFRASFTSADTDLSQLFRRLNTHIQKQVVNKRFCSICSNVCVCVCARALTCREPWLLCSPSPSSSSCLFPPCPPVSCRTALRRRKKVGKFSPGLTVKIFPSELNWCVTFFLGLRQRHVLLDEPLQHQVSCRVFGHVELQREQNPSRGGTAESKPLTRPIVTKQQHAPGPRSPPAPAPRWPAEPRPSWRASGPRRPRPGCRSR